MRRLDILVVEDMPVHQEAASEQLGVDHNLEVVGSFDEAVDLFVGERNFYGKKKEEHNYDMLLTDLMFPQGRGDCQTDKSKAREVQPFGYVLAMIAAKKGIPNIAIVTDGSHHNGGMVYAMDFFDPYNCTEPYFRQEPLLIGSGRVLFINQGVEIDNDLYNGGKGQKNWKIALKRLIGKD
jgi:CheY-like chemotaxis protein